MIRVPDLRRVSVFAPRVGQSDYSVGNSSSGACVLAVFTGTASLSFTGATTGSAGRSGCSYEYSSLNRYLYVACDCPRNCGLNPNSTMRPRPYTNSIAAPLPSIASGCSSSPLSSGFVSLGYRASTAPWNPGSAWNAGPPWNITTGESETP